MRILYGVQGTGNGHLARARSLLPALRNENIEVDCLLSGRDRSDFFDMAAFGEFQCVQGFTLVVENGTLNFGATLRRNSLWSFCKDVKAFQLDRYDLVISDFEPVTAWAARLKRKTCIGISHQNAFHYPVPKVEGYTASRLLMRYFAPVDVALGFHWHHFNQPLLPPLIEPHASRSAITNKILVYMGFEALEDICAFLQPFTDFQFFVFAKVAAGEDRGHIHIRPLSHAEFHQHLEDSSGVISNAGFELASECLALGKKLLVKPISGQFEQLSNALALQALQRATVIESLDQTALAQWLQLSIHVPIHYPDVGKAIAGWLRRGQQETVPELAAALWDDLTLAYHYDENFGNKIVPGLVV